MGLLKAARGDWRKSGGYSMQYGVMGCSKWLMVAKHRIRIENFCRDSKKLKYLEK